MCNVGFASIQCMEGTCLTVEKAVSQTVDKIHVQFSSESAKNRKKSENVLLNSPPPPPATCHFTNVSTIYYNNWKIVGTSTGQAAVFHANTWLSCLYFFILLCYPIGNCMYFHL